MARRIFIVEDHALVRWGYGFLVGREMDLEVCGEVGTAQEALEQIPLASPDLVIVDIVLEGMNGIELIKHLKVNHPTLPVLVVSAHEEELYAERALRAGASGYVMKSEEAGAFLQAIRQVLSGQRYLSERLREMLLNRYLEGGASAPDTREQAPAQGLTDRELEMFEHLGRGLERRQIAEAMLISPKTVDTYRERIKAKLGVKTSAQLRQHAVAWIQREEIFEHNA